MLKNSVPSRGPKQKMKKIHMVLKDSTCKNEKARPETTAVDVMVKERCFIFFPNVPRQVSLAGGAGGSQRMGAKALGLLFASQALCLSA